MRNQTKQILEKVKREMKDGCEEDVEKVNMKSLVDLYGRLTRVMIVELEDARDKSGRSLTSLDWHFSKFQASIHI